MVPSHDVMVVRAGEAEIVGGAPVTGRLYTASSATGGALSNQRITLLQGAAGAPPQHHTGSSERFYVVSGAAPMLAAESVMRAEEGDLCGLMRWSAHARLTATGAN
jgi:mannose-6-phosphate isomerase-like protein (cupin superfamily)